MSPFSIMSTQAGIDAAINYINTHRHLPKQVNFEVDGYGRKFISNFDQYSVKKDKIFNKDRLYFTKNGKTKMVIPEDPPTDDNQETLQLVRRCAITYMKENGNYDHSSKNYEDVVNALFQEHFHLAKCHIKKNYFFHGARNHLWKDFCVDINHNDDLFNKMEDALKKTNNKVKKNTTDIAQLQTQVSHIDGDLDATNTEVQQLRGEVQQLRGQVQQQGQQLQQHNVDFQTWDNRWASVGNVTDADVQQLRAQMQQQGRQQRVQSQQQNEQLQQLRVQVQQQQGQQAQTWDTEFDCRKEWKEKIRIYTYHRSTQPVWICL